MTRLLTVVLCMLTVVGCAKPKIIHIASPEETAAMAIEDIIADKKMSVEQKSQLIQIKMSESLERKKKAVETERDEKLSTIIKKPITPLRTPDTILRVLVLPYEDNKGVLNSWRYSFIKVDDGKWVLSDYLNGTRPSSKQTLTPLK